MHILISGKNGDHIVTFKHADTCFFIFQSFPKSGNKTDVNRQLSGNVVDRFFHVIISILHFLFFVVVFQG